MCAVSLAACGDADATEPGAGGSSAGNDDSGSFDPDADPHQACVDRINELRATLGLSPLQRWTEAEACSNQQSAGDQASRGPHANFGDCQEFGQNTCPDWPGLDAVLGGCLDAMWDEGPPPAGACDDACFQAHGHYMNMTNPKFTKVACGFHKDGQGNVWSNQNFR